jgi:hypothetical protein
MNRSGPVPSPVIFPFIPHPSSLPKVAVGAGAIAVHGCGPASGGSATSSGSVVMTSSRTIVTLECEGVGTDGRRTMRGSRMGERENRTGNHGHRGTTLAPGDGASSGGQPRPPNRRIWLGVGVYLLAISGLVVLMQLPGFDPTSFDGRVYGAFMTCAWCAGLLVWTLGIARRHGSRFTLRTLVILTAAIAVFLGLSRAIGPAFPTLFTAAGLSVAMLCEARQFERNAEAGARPYRGPVSRTVMVMGSLLFLAHFCRLLGVAALRYWGVLSRPA